MANFKERYLAGEIEFEEIDDYVDEWNNSCLLYTSHLKMRKVFLLPNVWKEGLLKLTITIGLQSSSYIKRC